MIRVILGCVMALWASLAVAQDFSGLARFDEAASEIVDTRDGVELRLQLSQGVPWRVFTLQSPPRLVMDFREVDWREATPESIDRSERAVAVRMGGFRPGWSRMVVDLAGPYGVAGADMAIATQTGAAILTIQLEDMDAESFAAASGAPDLPGWEATGTPLKGVIRPRQRGDTPLVVVIDPGHGGIDPGAEQGDVNEKELMLAFSKELKDMLLRAGEFDVILTREEDIFVSLEGRVALAHQVQADLFISFHADALSEGRANGATVYTLSDSASDKASAALAERHDRADILAGIDLSESDDVVADVLMDLARQETQPRAEEFAKSLKAGIEEQGLPLNSRPLRSAGFSVLKSPDIPSVLLELGFLSSERDRTNITDPGWRNEMAKAVVQAIQAWRISDAAQADLVRQ
ncbi:N-acetylmuramoyl-L-alanine amidase [Roseovarius rhodophyticola]|uniref:N-acetylmuramoyl-L-alanine amidase n=1 Tax=Roseovarius rhodophyticola TaxID=3080827 RepID=A0ABZ2TEV0_9RHOB|nr:N-acetylmuramoyl-L-alanine amidase [Roseovarius sp. W115]MDV2928506.1 N-acetylmuramoyl-L-alanine amidase [Roseovarius sp. W115]